MARAFQLLVDALTGRDDSYSRVDALLLWSLLFFGARYFIAIVLNVLQFVWRQYLRPQVPLKKYGKWAIVTGATDGIGREYCNAFAKQGLNIYLISRTEDKLRAAADEIRAKYGVETSYYVADLVAAGSQAHDGSCWYGLAANLSSLDVGILVNNAGMSHGHPDYVADVPPSDVDGIVAINVASLTKMTQAVLTGMVERRRGCIVNVSSGVSAALPACPLLAVYAASKAYVDSFSRSLAAEYRGRGIDVQVQAPAFVATKMAKIRRASLTVPTPAAWVAAAVRHIGYETVATAYPAHALLMAAARALPEALVVSNWMGSAKAMRARALKKREAAAKAQ